jgi:nucleoside-diphosphate kinase
VTADLFFIATMNNHSKTEKTLVLVKPDGVMRGLTGEIISRFERRGLKVVALRMVWPTKDHIARHYPESDEWFKNVGARAAAFFADRAMDVQKHLGTHDHIAIGKQVKSWLGNYMTEGPVVAMVIQGMHAITTVRKLVGHTYPVEALPGTIRGDFSVDAPTVANLEKRIVKNIVHASGNHEEAAHEISHWFSPAELYEYKRADEDTMF